MLLENMEAAMIVVVTGKGKEGGGLGIVVLYRLGGGDNNASAPHIYNFVFLAMARRQGKYNVLSTAKKSVFHFFLVLLSSFRQEGG